MIASTLKAQRGKDGGGIGPEETLVADTVRSHPRPGSNSNGNLVAAPLEASDGHHGYSSPRGDGADNLVTAFDWMAGAPASDNEQSGGRGRKWIHRAGDYAGALSKSRHDAVGIGASVRRLIPVECERLQGLEDGWTDLGDTPDSPRYAALGDAVTASVAHWLGMRIRR